MKQITIMLALFMLGACGGGAGQEETVTTEKPTWAEFAAATIADYYEANPETAVYAGLHQYDGQMGDNSLAAAEEYAAWIDRVIADAESYDGLQGIEAFERDYRLAVIACLFPPIAWTSRGGVNLAVEAFQHWNCDELLR